jgi:monolysocardiolipin acyltransferase
MGAVGALCRGFLYGLSNTEVHGLDGFLELLDERENVERRERGLITGNANANIQFYVVTI